MLQSKLFFKAQKEFPKDEQSVNAQLLIRANFVHKLMAGVYSFLPLGQRVRENIMNIIREEMNALGAAEILMPALHPRSVWEVAGRWELLGKERKIMYQFKDHSGREVGLGTTHEEVIADVAKSIISSYSDLPLAVYQIQTKFRDEPRAKSGLLRTREFTMKDLYSFHVDQDSLDKFYEAAKKAYAKIFLRCGLRAILTEASGGDFSKYSHEFMVETEAGEDKVLFCRLCGYAQNMEIAEQKSKEFCPRCKNGVLEKVKSVEVGNIFKLGTRYSEPTGLTYKDKNGGIRPVVMASYGIGVERLMGTIVEVHHDKNGIIWPESVAPALVHLLLIGEAESELKDFGDRVYNDLVKSGISVLYDDRSGLSAGEKLVEADLLGLPYRVIVSDKTFIQDKVEVKKRAAKEVKLVKLQDLIKVIKK